MARSFFAVVGIALAGCSSAPIDETGSSEAAATGDEIVTEVDYAAAPTTAPEKAWSSEATFATGGKFDASKYTDEIFERYGKGATLHEVQGTPHREYEEQFGIVGEGNSTPVPITIRYAVIEPTGTPRNEAALIVHGMTESSAVYAELAMDLAAQGYVVFVTNHRGHGFSDRLVDAQSQTAEQIDNVSKHVHIGDFEDYVSDLHLVVQKAQERGKVFGIAHSMGGGIMTRYLELHPAELERVALVAPMHKINVESGVKGYGVRLFADFKGERDDASRSSLPPDTLAYDADSYTLATDNGTTSAVRWGAKIFANVEMTKTHPTFTNGGATFGWVREVIVGTEKIRKEAKRIKTPLIILQADNDAYVEPSGHMEVCKGVRDAGGACRILHFAGTKHEILYHGDRIRNAALDAIYTHFTAP